VKGKTGCTVCIGDSVLNFLDGSRKGVYLGIGASWWKVIYFKVKSSIIILVARPT
jgi:hypothetical protein